MLDPVPHLNRALKGVYRLEEQLGVGGMARVYLAEDLKHKRKVAIKVVGRPTAVPRRPDFSARFKLRRSSAIPISFRFTTLGMWRAYSTM